MKHQAILLLGSNLEDRLRMLELGEQNIEALAGKVMARSSIYSSAAWGNTDQPDFLNRVIGIETEQTPADLLRCLLRIELLHGRARKEKWGPRTLDIDILYYDDLVYQDELLIIPHPGIAGRRFTLVPLCELFPEYIHPVCGRSNQWLLENCKDTSGVALFNLAHS
ncbi:MAG: 2-amino-4-hydroxy-6-hydroxymethyldihydropteridine diphosphokinase [Bacteroidia bacterium]|nr:2-amino-4-hydroxy-6-hydroxymethyldihydropteridine diphosphokinase [Bacteroidia bacterium]